MHSMGQDNERNAYFLHSTVIDLYCNIAGETFVIGKEDIGIGPRREFAEGVLVRCIWLPYFCFERRCIFPLHEECRALGIPSFMSYL